MDKSKTHHKILKTLERKPNEEVDIIINSLAEKVTAKTDCLSCGNCCKTKGPALNKKDINRIAKFLEITPPEFADRYLTYNENDDKVMKNIPCEFLGKDNYCSIYEVRPDACASYPHLHLRNTANLFDYMIAHAPTCPIIDEVIDSI